MLVLSTYACQQLILDATESNASAFYGILQHSQVMLYTSQVALSPQTTLAQLTEATFPGYARVNATWDSMYTEQDYSASILTSLIQFLATAAPSPAQTIYGYGLVSTLSGTPLIFSEQFAVPLVISQALDAVNLVLKYNVGSLTLSPGAAVVIG